MSGAPRTSSASTGAGKTTSKEFSPLQKLFVVCVVLSTLGGVCFFVSGQAASTVDVTLSPTRVAETLTTNPQLETGLVGHWTFDGDQMDWSSTTAEVRDRSGQGNKGDALGGMSTRSVASGVLGQALKFDGTNDSVNVGTVPGVDFTHSYTVSMWANADRLGDPTSNCGTKRAIFWTKTGGGLNCPEIYITGGAVPGIITLTEHATDATDYSAFYNRRRCRHLVPCCCAI